jgi:hypothetical protein
VILDAITADIFCGIDVQLLHSYVSLLHMVISYPKQQTLFSKQCSFADFTITSLAMAPRPWLICLW